MKIPDLPKEAANELPAATDKVSKYRGTYVWWVTGFMLSAIVSLAIWGSAQYNRGLLDGKKSNEPTIAIWKDRFEESEKQNVLIWRKYDSILYIKDNSEREELNILRKLNIKGTPNTILITPKNTKQ